MYEKLCRQLCAMASTWGLSLPKEAADTIEELSAHYCPHAIRNVHDRGDDSLCRVYECEVKELPRWIPATERCPEKSGDYLVFDDCRNIYVNEWHCLLKKWQYDDSRITHWMPLPEPPKEET